MPAPFSVESVPAAPACSVFDAPPACAWTHKRRWRHEQARWHLKISEEADRQVRGFLAERGYKKGDLSPFVEETVRWRVLDRTTEEMRDRFSDLSAEEVDRLSEEAVRFARLARRRN